MKKMGFMLPILGVSILNLTSCEGPKWPWDKNTEKSKFEINVNFGFYKDGNKKEKFPSTNFEINTRIFIAVDFEIKSNIDKEEAIGFKVEIPYAEYYSKKDFFSGTLILSENEYTKQDKQGHDYTVKELGPKTFDINKYETRTWTYMFEIEAIQICESADFIVEFSPENSNLSIEIKTNENNENKEKNTAKVSYSFKEKVNS